MDKYHAYKRGRQLADGLGLSDWSIVVDDTRNKRKVGTHLGQCNAKMKQIIVFDWWLQELEDTIHDNRQLDVLLLHELAHAKTKGYGHRSVWQRTFTGMLSDHWLNYPTSDREWLIRMALRDDRYCRRNEDQLMNWLGDGKWILLFPKLW